MTESHSNTQPTATDSFLKNLRSATGPMHSALEANPVSASLMAPDLSRATYRRYLTLMGEVISFTEKTIFPAVKDIIPDIDQRLKSDHIHADLAALQDAPADSPAIFHPDEKEFSLPFAMGYMYVIEGSTLGGRVILKHVQDKLGLSEDQGVAFFAGYGTETGMRWKNFLSNLTNYAEQSGSGDEIIKGAQHAFAAIDRYFAANS